MLKTMMTTTAMIMVIITAMITIIISVTFIIIMRMMMMRVRMMSMRTLAVPARMRRVGRMAAGCEVDAGGEPEGDE